MVSELGLVVVSDHSDEGLPGESVRVSASQSPTGGRPEEEEGVVGTSSAMVVGPIVAKGGAVIAQGSSTTATEEAMRMAEASSNGSTGPLDGDGELATIVVGSLVAAPSNVCKMSSNNLDLNSSSSSTSASTGGEQLCYIPCSFCSIILAVSVPCSSLFDIVTVRCGHCTNLWSVNMASALHSLPTTWQHQQQQLQHQHQHRNLPHQQMHPQLLQHDHHHLQHLHHRHQDFICSLQDPSAIIGPRDRQDLVASNASLAAFGRCNKSTTGTIRMMPTRAHEERANMTNRPPEKKQRTPSAYNQFIREEIQRIKANNPEISHREAFSTAAKNFGLMLENNNQARLAGEGPEPPLLPSSPSPSPLPFTSYFSHYLRSLTKALRRSVGARGGRG
ncbi:hypothetical protein Taro_053556 [Colocasia esculenta]|uniref:YABBY transcription factor n=1 Tax=Colocasia esculenta TaxID=4460 RepID=A0A843XLI2_COLES|nr:hypothetical protein [Colocasia esculenta]